VVLAVVLAQRQPHGWQSVFGRGVVRRPAAPRMSQTQMFQFTGGALAGLLLP
jgi:hypothetical protein